MLNLRWSGLACSASAALLVLAACAREGQDEMGWARTALERNGDIEVVAADPHSQTFTVRLKSTGELRTVRADEVMASPAPAAAATAAASAPAPVAATAPANTAGTTPGAATAAVAPEPATAENAAPERAAPSQASQPSSLVPQSSAAAEAASGKVLESGPGYTIKAASAATGASGPSERAVTNAVLERRHEPIVCQGPRLVHIDNRNLSFDGDAVNAEDGCEIHITNSHIRAGGVGILARAANVHIDNSFIEGEGGSIDASEGAQIYAASSRFKGLSRRLDNAALHDLGGNIWN